MFNSYIKALIYIALACLASIASSTQAALKMTPTPLVGLEYNKKLLKGEYQTSIPKIEQLLGFTVGQKAATPEQLLEVLKNWEKASDKIKLVEYARSHEDRPLIYAIISTAENIARVDSVKQDLAKLANPKNLAQSDAESIIARLPAVAWLGYSIHGNEGSGGDSALAAIYHLIASKQADTQKLLNDSIIIIDPLMNPDGRARFTKSIQQNRGVSPNVDDQSLIHSGLWPHGRTNHYLFDLNRDFILGVHPESIGRIKAINQWYPQLMVDGHEMGSQATYLFSPSREPVNKHLSSKTKKWANLFANDQAASFDDENWPYYTGEWLENLYPGYSSYAEFRGSIHILYEQARIFEDGVRQGNDRIVTYAESVHHQLTSTLTNLKTLAKHSKGIYRDFLADRRENISSKSPYADISFALPPSKNKKRWSDFIELMQLQGLELFTTNKAMSFNKATNQLGDKVTAELPAGSLIIRNRQPEARLLAAILEFEAKIDDAVLIKERQKLLRDGSSLMYDTTAWNLTMMHDLEAFTIPAFIDSNIKPYQADTESAAIVKKDQSIAYIVDGEDDASVGFAARLLEQGVQVRAIDKPAKLDNKEFSRGSVVVYRYDNEFFNGDLDSLVEQAAKQMSVSAVAISSGMGKGDLPDIGGSHFKLLKRPQIAILTRGGINANDFGTIWHSIDTNLGIRHSHLDLSTFSFRDLRRYNTLVVPDRNYGKFSKEELDAIDSWVKSGGTLIAINDSVRDFTIPENKISKVRTVENSFKDIESYDLALQQEWLAQQDGEEMLKNVWSHDTNHKIKYPWNDKAKPVEEKTLQKQDKWLKQFMPSGAFAAARSDQKHWLTFGTGERLPVLVSHNPLLMSAKQSQAVVRFGVYNKMDKSVWQKVLASFKDQPVSRKVGWASLPDEYELKLRMSGLLWPEASERIANAAYLTRESRGKGQIILFAGEPAFRGSTKATNRLLLNALVYGAGLGTHQVINP